MENYEKLETLGEGMFGVVYKAKDKRTDEIIALKKIRVGKARLQEGVHFTALREIKFLSEVKHDNILRLFEMFSHKSNIYMALELMYSDLERVIQAKHVPLTFKDIEFYMLETCQGVAFLHKNWVLHRDLKPSNLLITRDGNVRLADFGLARSFGSQLPGEVPMTHQVVTRWYRAPELLFGARFYGTGVDSWALGCIFAELLLRGPFLAGDTDIDQLTKIVHAMGAPTSDNWPDCDHLPDYVAFTPTPPTPLKQMFPAADDDAIALLAAFLKLDPRQRVSPADALDTFAYLQRRPDESEFEDLQRDRARRLAQIEVEKEKKEEEDQLKRSSNTLDGPVKKRLVGLFE